MEYLDCVNWQKFESHQKNLLNNYLLFWKSTHSFDFAYRAQKEWNNKKRRNFLSFKCPETLVSILNKKKTCLHCGIEIKDGFIQCLSCDYASCLHCMGQRDAPECWLETHHPKEHILFLVQTKFSQYLMEDEPLHKIPSVDIELHKVVSHKSLKAEANPSASPGKMEAHNYEEDCVVIAENSPTPSTSQDGYNGYLPDADEPVSEQNIATGYLINDSVSEDDRKWDYEVSDSETERPVQKFNTLGYQMSPNVTPNTSSSNLYLHSDNALKQVPSKDLNRRDWVNPQLHF